MGGKLLVSLYFIQPVFSWSLLNVEPSE